MNEYELKELKRLIALTGEYYSRTLTPGVIQMRAEDLQDLPFEKIQWGYRKWRMDGNTFDPLPAQIRGLIQPKVQDKCEATEAASRIVSAVSRYGHPNSADARQFIGELGWRVVQMQGGWVNVCSMLGDSYPVGQAQAQWRDLGLALMEKARAGRLDEPPALPKPNNPSRLESGPTSIGQLVGDIAQKLNSEKQP